MYIGRWGATKLVQNSCDAELAKTYPQADQPPERIWEANPSQGLLELAQNNVCRGLNTYQHQVEVDLQYHNVGNSLGPSIRVSLFAPDCLRFSTLPISSGAHLVGFPKAPNLQPHKLSSCTDRSCEDFRCSLWTPPKPETLNPKPFPW